MSHDFSLMTHDAGAFRLEKGELHVWHANLSGGFAGDVAVLDADERARAARLRLPGDRAHFIAAHAFTRVVIASYLDCGPQDVRYVHSANGKPSLAQGSNPADLRFNASRTGHYAAVALTRSREVGVDVEAIVPRAGLDLLIARALSENERANLAALSGAEREAVFFRFWARKEAYLKARGLGLALSPSDVDTASPDALRVKGEPETGWRVEDIALAPGYAAAVAGEGRDWRVATVRAFTAPVR